MIAILLTLSVILAVLSASSKSSLLPGMVALANGLLLFAADFAGLEMAAPFGIKSGALSFPVRAGGTGSSRSMSMSSSGEEALCLPFDRLGGWEPNPKANRPDPADFDLVVGLEDLGRIWG